MRVTVIGHATLFIETGGPTLLVDPWFTGSCGWRSWWHFPPSAPPRPEWLAPDFLAITHHHPDHFHYPTMRKLDRRTRVLVPRFGVDVMAGELRKLGFDDVRELPHGEIHELALELRIASYQYGFDDTVLVAASGTDVAVDFNDCKMRGRPLREISRAWGRPTLLFKAHSFAQAYPHCYRAEDPADLELLSRETYVEDFLDVVRALEPRYAVPFASMVAFLHPESAHVNPHLVTPGEVADAFAEAPGMGASELVTLSPGDSWDSETGFTRSETDWYGERSRHLEKLAAEVRPAIARSAALEAERALPFENFAAYFGRFLRALPPLSGRLLLRRPIVFEVPSSPEPYWVLDFGRRAVRREREAPSNRASLVRVPEGVLADAIEKGIVHFVHGSMRIDVELRPGGVNEDLAFWGLLAVWEIGYLPASRALSPRFAAAAWRRRRELGEALGQISGGGTLLRRLSRGFAAPR